LWTSAKPNTYASDAFSNTSGGYAHSDANWYASDTYSSAYANTYTYAHTST